LWFSFILYYFFVIFLDIPLRVVEGSDESLFELTPNSINFNTVEKYVSVFLDKKIEKVFFICFLIFMIL
jgi:hypothetical protein